MSQGMLKRVLFTQGASVIIPCAGSGSVGVRFTFTSVGQEVTFYGYQDSDATPFLIQGTLYGNSDTSTVATSSNYVFRATGLAGIILKLTTAVANNSVTIDSVLCAATPPS